MKSTSKTIFFAISLAIKAVGGQPDKGDLESHVSDVEFQKSVRIAEKLGTKKDKESFVQLLELLKDKNIDVSYEASIALGLRAQCEFIDLLLTTCNELGGDRKWFGYKLLGNYLDKKALIFLTDAMKNEFQTIQPNKPYDDKNYFYIKTSIDMIIKTWTGSVKAPGSQCR